MAVNTILLDFSVDPGSVRGESQAAALASSVEAVLRDYLADLKPVAGFAVDGGLCRVYTSGMGAVTTVRTFDGGLVTVSVEYYRAERQEALLSFERCKILESDMRDKLIAITNSQSYPAMRRCKFIRFYPTSDERLLEYDIDGIVFEERSAFQKVQIVHSRSLGNMLVLDDLQNISENDLIYTETLMCKGKESYAGKEIAILGGGDGALLFELLKEAPANVLMLEIDDVVIKACSKHMRSICGNVLDNKSGPNYQIVIGDCMESLDLFVKEGRKFDYIFGDLTDIPISDAPTGEIWTFIHNVLDVVFKLLKPTGKFMTHGNGASCVDALQMYEDYLKQLTPPLEFTKSKAFVPSFMEDWIFYQIGFVDGA